MPFKSKATIRKCKYCDNPVKINYYDSGDRKLHKGYLRTCGSEECLRTQYADHGVSQKKSYFAKGIQGTCSHCGNAFIKAHYKQRWCKDCVPERKDAAIIRRYQISHNEHKQMLATNNGLCWICLKRAAKVVDHCHKTGNIRGLLCHHCNTALNLIENKEALERAIKYVSIS